MAAPPPRFQATVAAPWADDKKRRLAVPRPGWRALSLMAALSTGALLLLAFSLPVFRVGTPLVSGTVRLPPEEIVRALGLADQPIFTLRPADLSKHLLAAFPDLQSAEVRIYLPNKVWARVAERTPIITWQEGDGYAWIDASGIAFRPRGEAAGLIVVQAAASPPRPTVEATDALRPPPYIHPDLVQAILQLAPSVPAGSVLTYDEENGLGWKDPRGWQAAFGTSPDDIAVKLRVYQALTASLEAQGLYPAIISVAHPDAPFYRMAGTEEECPTSDEACLGAPD